MTENEESEGWLGDVSNQRIEYFSGGEDVLGSVARRELWKSDSDNDDELELEMNRVEMYRIERVPQDIEGASSGGNGTQRKAKRGENQRRMEIGQRLRQMNTRHIANDDVEDTDSSSYNEKKALIRPLSMASCTDHDGLPSSVEESVCTEENLPHQSPQKMLLEGYGEEVAEVDDWEVRQALKLYIYIHMCVCSAFACIWGSVN